MTTDTVTLESADDIALADKMNAGRKQIIAELHKRIIGQDDVHRARAADAVRRRQQPDRRRARPGQDAAHRDAGARSRAEVQPHPVHARPDAVRHHRHRHHSGRRDDGRRQMVFAPGPIFANIVLADEINRTPPKTQAALLEAMQEHRVTIQGRTYDLDEPFYVFATQNPIELEGTYPLPEAQLDRFMFHIVIEHPPEEEEFDVVRTTTAIIDPHFKRPVSGADLIAFQRLVRRVPVAEPVMRYALSLVRTSRPKSQAGARVGQEIRGVRRQRPRGAVPRARRQGARAHQRPLSRQLRGHPRDGASRCCATAC